MVQTTSTMIYIGNLPIIDTDEGNSATENAAAIAGTYVDSQMQMVDVTNHDQDGDGVIWSDEFGGPDYVSYTLRGEPETVTEQDAIIIYSARITEVDGTVHDVEVSVIQMPNGDTFVNDYGNAGNTDDLFIDSIELIAPTQTGSAGRNTFATTSNTTVCFTPGTLLSAPQGSVPIERLRPGDLVDTLDRGPLPILWRRRQRHILAASQSPVEIATGALGCGLPLHPLRLSPQHRVLVNASVVRRMFGLGEVLIAAKKLLPLEGVSQPEQPGMIEYWHILLDGHQVVMAAGAPVESLWTGDEVRRIMPDALHLPPLSMMQSARPIPEGRRQKQLVQRLLRNNQTCLRPGFDPSALHTGIGAVACQNAPEAARFIQ